MTGADNITTPITKFASLQTAGRQKSNEGPNSITESLLGCCCRRVWPGTDLSHPPPPPPPEEILASSHPEPETWWGLLCRYRHCRLNIFPAVRPPEESNMWPSLLLPPGDPLASPCKERRSLVRRVGRSLGSWLAESWPMVGPCIIPHWTRVWDVWEERERFSKFYNGQTSDIRYI